MAAPDAPAAIDSDRILVIDEVAFQRLAATQIELSEGRESLQTTHQKLSVELGTAREVVSRQLAEFQRRGWVHASRGAIDILDQPALTRLAEEG